MRLLIFGATGRTGRHLVDQGASRGLEVYAAARDETRLTTLTGTRDSALVDVNDADAVAHAVGRIRPDAIISSVGGASADGRLIDEIGNDAITDASVRCGVRRIIQISSLGCGDSRAFASERIIAAIGPVLEAKTRAEDRLRRADLDWTIVRPGGLTDGEMTGQGALYDDPRVHGRISRADLASLVLQCVAAADTKGRTLSAVDRASLPAQPADIAEYVIAGAA